MLNGQRMMKFKTLVLKEGTKFQEFMHFNYGRNEWFTCNTPDLRPIAVTMDLIIEHYPSFDLTDVTLETIEIKIIKE